MARLLRMELRGAAALTYWRGFSHANLNDRLASSVFKAVSIMHGDLVEKGFTNRVTRHGMFMSSAAGNAVASRSGAARDRLTADVIRRGRDLLGVVGSPDMYILANETGARIRPKRSKFLAIPTVNILTPTGKLKDEWAAKLAGGGWRGIWQSEGLFIFRGKRRGTSGAWIARKKPGTARSRRSGKFKTGSAPTAGIELLAYLVPEVNLPARWMFRTSARRVSSRVSAAIGTGVQTLMRSAPRST